MSKAISELNALTSADFIDYLADIYEHSPWVAECASHQRPFADISQLAAKMQQCVRDASPVAQMTLIRAHPELAGKLAISGNLTTASQAEQSAAGLNHCSAAEFASLSQLNAAYQLKFGFPFIIAVRGLNRSQIIDALTQRMTHTPAQEIAAALDEIGRIALFRLNDLLTDC
jgi:2-oxo-4-hydroxy-4-carboxy-5-ureidoimidazoline decarboxylase